MIVRPPGTESLLGSPLWKALEPASGYRQYIACLLAKFINGETEPMYWTDDVDVWSPRAQQQGSAVPGTSTRSTAQTQVALATLGFEPPALGDGDDAQGTVRAEPVESAQENKSESGDDMDDKHNSPLLKPRSLAPFSSSDDEEELTFVAASDDERETAGAGKAQSKCGSKETKTFTTSSVSVSGDGTNENSDSKKAGAGDDGEPVQKSVKKRKKQRKRAGTKQAAILVTGKRKTRSQHAEQEAKAGAGTRKKAKGTQ